VLIVGYEDTAVVGKTGVFINPIQAGAGSINVTLTLESDLISEDGTSLKEGVELITRINVFDQTAGQYVNIYPGGVELFGIERTGDHSPVQDRVQFRSLNLAENEAGQTILTAELLYQLQTTSAATMTVTLQDQARQTLGGQTLAIDDRIMSAEVALTFDAAVLDADTPLTLRAVIETGDSEPLPISDRRALTLGDFAAEGDNQVRIIDVVENRAADGTLFSATLLAGYTLDEAFVGGTLSFTTNGSGGGQTVLPGAGLVDIDIPLSLPPGSDAADWRDTLALTVDLSGRTADGTETTLDSAVWEPIE
jgi:hypothetical protein